MRQERIMVLLQNAAEPRCTATVKAEILKELMHAAAAQTGLHLAVTHVFQSTVCNRPHALPGMFAFFAAACGDRKPEQHYAEIDWSVVSATAAPQRPTLASGQFFNAMGYE